MKGFTILAMLLVSFTTWGQDHGPVAVILVQITDKTSGEPIEGVNVYLANTKRGGWSTADGKYILENIPLGSYELVISRVGYSQSISSVTVARAETLSLRFELSESLLAVDEVEVTREPDEEWEQNLERFRRAFLGPSKFTDDCVILNPEVLDLSYRNDTLIATATGSLRIDNNALGYRLQVVLDLFVWNVEHDYGQYKVYPFFEELTPNDQREATRWKENRETAWKGSLRHFFQTFCRGDSESDRFILYTGRLKILVSGQGHRILSSEFQGEPIDGTDYTEYIIPDPLRIEYGFQELGTEPTLRRPTKRTPNSIIPTDPVNVSILNVRDSTLVIDSHGNLFDPLRVEVAGEWGKSRVSELLPTR